MDSHHAEYEGTIHGLNKWTHKLYEKAMYMAKLYKEGRNPDAVNGYAVSVNDALQSIRHKLTNGKNYTTSEVESLEHDAKKLEFLIEAWTAITSMKRITLDGGAKKKGSKKGSKKSSKKSSKRNMKQAW